MEEMNTNTNLNMNPRRGSRTKKVILGVLIALLVLVAGGGIGYLLGNMNKSQEVEKAKQDAKAEAEQQHQASNNNNENQNHQAPSAPPKTVTATTCNADELSLKVTDGSDSGAGTLAYNLELTNTGSRTCTLGGFPGVSLVNDNGNMIGSPAERATNFEEKTLTLAPNTTVKSVVYVENSTNFDDGECKSGATKFRVYPPNDTGYLSIASSVDTWCPGFMVSPVLAM